MAHRLEKVAHIVRDVVSDAINNRVSDPRIAPFTSITRVEMSGDLKIANVFISVMGDEIKGQTTMKGLESARGMIQGRVARQLDMRTCPSLRFHLDRGIKTAIETIKAIDEALARPAALPQNQASNDPTEGDEDSIGDTP